MRAAGNLTPPGSAGLPLSKTWRGAREADAEV
jgi:hypothetical protein